MLQHHAEDLGGTAEIADRKRFLGAGNGLGDLGFDRAFGGLGDRGAGNHLVGKAAHFTFGHGAHEAIDRTTAGKGEDGRNGLDAELTGNLRIFVDVDLDEANRTGLLIDDLFERRGQLAARAAPGGPEVNQHGLLERGVDHIGLERLIGRVLYQGTGSNTGLGSGGNAIERGRHGMKGPCS
jgi:hypothetical protein